jgi:hypothetical protein
MVHEFDLERVTQDAIIYVNMIARQHADATVPQKVEMTMQELSELHDIPKELRPDFVSLMTQAYESVDYSSFILEADFAAAAAQWYADVATTVILASPREDDLDFPFVRGELPFDAYHTIRDIILEEAENMHNQLITPGALGAPTDTYIVRVEEDFAAHNLDTIILEGLPTRVLEDTFTTLGRIAQYK